MRARTAVASPSLMQTDSLANAFTVNWPDNLSYLVTNTANAGSYNVYYRQNTPGPPYDGTDAEGGSAPSPVAVLNSTSLTLSDLSPVAPTLTAPVLLSATGANSAVGLTWTSVDNAIGYRIHYGVSSVNENLIDVADVTEARVTGLANGTTYRFAVSGLSRATYYVVVTAVDSTPNQNEGAFSAESSLAIGPTLENAKSNELTAPPELILAYPILPNEDACFIATAAFGADWTSEVRLLRRFRDQILLTNPAGRWFVRQYYRFSPPLADLIRAHESMRAVVRWLLMPLVALAWLLLDAPLWLQVPIAALMPATLFCFVVIRRRAKSATEVVGRRELGPCA